MAVISGCARWPYEPGPEPEPEYQLRITVEVAGEINPDEGGKEGKYYIVLVTDESSAGNPGYEVDEWDGDYYYIALDKWGYFSFIHQTEEDSDPLSLTDGSYSGGTLQVTVALSDLGDPNSVDISVVTTDTDNYTYDHLDGYFTISTDIDSTGEGTIEDDSGEGGPDFEISKVSAVIIAF